MPAPQPYVAASRIAVRSEGMSSVAERAETAGGRSGWGRRAAGPPTVEVVAW